MIPKKQPTDDIRRINFPLVKEPSKIFFWKKTTKHEETALDELRKKTIWHEFNQEQQQEIERHFQNYQKKKIEKPKEPLLLLIKENMNGEVYEEVAAGTIVLNENQTSDKKQRLITLDRSKLIGFRWGDDVIRCYVAFEKEATAYPHHIQHDSRTIKNIIDMLLNNRTNFDAKQIGAIGDLIIKIAIAIVILGAVFLWFLPMFGIDILNVKAQAVAQTITNTGTMSGQT